MEQEPATQEMPASPSSEAETETEAVPSVSLAMLLMWIASLAVSLVVVGICLRDENGSVAWVFERLPTYNIANIVSLGNGCFAIGLIAFWRWQGIRFPLKPGHALLVFIGFAELMWLTRVAAVQLSFLATINDVTWIAESAFGVAWFGILAVLSKQTWTDRLCLAVLMITCAIILTLALGPRFGLSVLISNAVEYSLLLANDEVMPTLIVIYTAIWGVVYQKRDWLDWFGLGAFVLLKAYA